MHKAGNLHLMPNPRYSRMTLCNPSSTCHPEVSAKFHSWERFITQIIRKAEINRGPRSHTKMPAAACKSIPLITQILVHMYRLYIGQAFVTVITVASQPVNSVHCASIKYCGTGWRLTDSLPWNVKINRIPWQLLRIFFW